MCIECGASGNVHVDSQNILPDSLPRAGKETRIEVPTKDPVMTMKKIFPRPESVQGRTSRMGPASLHGSASSPGLPNLAGAQIPGPGTKHLLYGEDGRLSDEAAGPWELEGHLGSRGGVRRFLGRLLGR